MRTLFKVVGIRTDEEPEWSQEKGIEYCGDVFAQMDDFVTVDLDPQEMLATAMGKMIAGVPLMEVFGQQAGIVIHHVMDIKDKMAELGLESSYIELRTWLPGDEVMIIVVKIYAKALS